MALGVNIVRNAMKEKKKKKGNFDHCNLLK